MAEGNSKPGWDPRDDVEYTYKRGGNDGDIIVFATSKADAQRTLEENGFRNIDVEKLLRTGKTLAEYLASGTEEKEPIQ